MSTTSVQLRPRQAVLSDEAEGPPYTIHGVAIGENDVTKGSSGIKKYWPAEELKKAADDLRGANLVVDHENSANGVVGRVTRAGYKENVGILYQAELFDEDLSDKVRNGLLEVSIRGLHDDVSTLEERDDALVVSGLTIENLSIVPSGAAPSNTLEIGESDELSEAELAEYTGEMEAEELQTDISTGDYVKSAQRGQTVHGIVESVNGQIATVAIHYHNRRDKWVDTDISMPIPLGALETWDVDVARVASSAELQEVEPADWVQWDDGEMHGIVLSIDGDTAEVDVYEEMDGTWRAADETEEVSVDALDSWDVDEDDVGAADDGEEEEENASSELAPPKDFMFESREDAEAFIEGKDGLTGVHEMDGMWMPGSSHEEFAEWHEEKHGEEMSETELQDYTIHEPDWGGTTESDWSTPDFEDFRGPYNLDEDQSWEDLDDDMRSAIGEHFIISLSGFPAETYGDMKLPVVEPNGDLNVNALAAVKGGRGVTAVDGLSSDEEQEIVDMVDMFANEHFDRNWGEDEEEMASDSGPVLVRTGDDLRILGASESDSDNTGTTKMTDEDIETRLEAELEDFEDPAVVEQDELEELRQTADEYESINEDIASLRERTEILDDVRREQVEELAESDDPIVVESARFEELEEEAENVKELLADNLSEELAGFTSDELESRFTVSELREKHEDVIGSVEEELSADPDPKSQDPSEEELEGSGDDKSEEELEYEERVEEKRAELKNKILGN